MKNKSIKKAKEYFAKIVEEQLNRIKFLEQEKWINYKELKPIKIGLIAGDGIGPYIVNEAKRVLKFLLKREEGNNKIQFKDINGLTIENRAKVIKAIPLNVLKEIKKCHAILKGPTTTPKKGDKWPNIESANVALRKELDLFANIRPVKIPKKSINWIFFRENTEGAYALGNKGIDITDELAVDFKITTNQGSERIIKMAFDYAKKNRINRVTVVTKANIIKTTDGKFLNIAENIAKNYKGIELDNWFVDIFSAKLLDSKRRKEFKVMVLPNLYGDIITDEAAEIQGGVGTAGSANIGKKYAMFEAIHGSALRMVKEGRAKYSNPSSILRASVMLLQHIGFINQANKLDKAIDFCEKNRKIIITGRANGATCSEFTNCILEKIK
jgi:isocitrate dehydrogenase (NAD+)